VWKVISPIVLALAVSLATAWINPSTDERAMYGNEGPLQQNWLPPKVSGWPAPFLADDPGTSVTHKIGFEDTFRLGSFIGTLSFWYLVILAARALIRPAIHARHRS